MRKYWPVMVGVMAVLTVALAAWLGFVDLRAGWDNMHNWDRRVDRGFNCVTIGMSRIEVEQLMRSAGTKLERFQLGQESGFERQYAEAERSKSAYWLSWHNGIDLVYTVGFDDHDRVTYKASGGT